VSEDTQANEARPKQYRLTGGGTRARVERSAGSWPETVERVIQQSVSKLFDQQDLDTYQLESTIMQRCLQEVCCRSLSQGETVEELSLFTRPLGIYSFQLRDRRYCCVESLPPVSGPAGVSDIDIEDLRQAARRQALRISSVTTELKEIPTTNELLSILLDHLQECHPTGDRPTAPQQTDEEEWAEWYETRVHSARRSSIRNWEYRLIQHVQRKFNHGDDEQGLYHYPFVDLVVTDGNTLLVLMVAPLDVNFVDEKVAQNDRVPDITLGIFDIAGQYFSGSLESLVPLLKQGFGRLLFTNMHYETDMALAETNEARATVLRYWVKLASSGIHGLLGRDRHRAPFDAFEFCEAVVRRVLCASVEGVDNFDVYPFDRAFVFYEAGTSTKASSEPMRMRVLEASMLSNASADRGQHLTSRERRIRGTDDFECNPSRKRIDAEDIIDFYIHPGDKKNLILTRQDQLDPEYKTEILRATRRSVTTDQAETYGYRFPVPEIEQVENDELASAIYNLMGRLISDNRTPKPIKDPLGDKEYKVMTFAEGFEKLRLRVTDRADESGLYYHYRHGLAVGVEETPLLHSLQRAYQTYLDDHFRAQDTQFLRERYVRENMPPDQVEEILRRHRQAERIQAAKGNDKGHSGRGTRQRSKVVYVSFSWQLHDENMRQMRQLNSPLIFPRPGISSTDRVG